MPLRLAACFALTAAPLLAFAAAFPAAAAQESDDPVAAARAMTEAEPANARAWLALAQALDANGDAEAEIALDQALEHGASDATVLEGAAELFAGWHEALVSGPAEGLAAESRRRADELYRQWSALAPGAARPVARLGALLRVAGDRQAGLAHALVAVARDPSEGAGHEELWRYLGAELPHDQLAGVYAALALGDLPPFERARCRSYEGQVLDRAGAASRSAAARDGAEGRRTGAISRLEDATRCYRRAIGAAAAAGALDAEWAARTGRDVARYRASLVEVLGTQGDSPAAQREAERGWNEIEPLLAAEPADPELRDAVERIAFGVFVGAGGEGGDPDAMDFLADHWSLATRVVRDDPAWFNNHGFFAREAKRYEESLEAYQQCIALAPDDVRYVNDTALILLYHLDRDHAQAEQLLRRAVALGAEQYPAAKDDPAREPALRSAFGDAMLNLGKVLGRLGRAAEGREWLDRLDAFAPGRQDAIEARIEIACREGDRAAAESLLSVLEAAAARGDLEARTMLRQLRPRLDREDGGDAALRSVLAARIDAVLAAPLAGDRP